MIKKLVSVFIVLSVLFTQLSFIISYAQNSNKNYNLDNEIQIQTDSITLSESYNAEDGGKPLKPYSLKEKGTGQQYNKEYYGMQLNEEQKNVYDVLKLNLSPDNTNEINIKLVNEIPFFSVTSNPTEDEKNVLRKKITSIVQPAVDALIKDNPSVFWLIVGNSKYVYSILPKNKTGEGINWKVEELRFLPANSSEASNYKAQLDEKIKNFDVKGSKTYDKLKSIHDQLTEIITYDEDAPRAHEATGALIDGKAVCEGYAKAFKLLCDRESIPCVLVIGNGVTSSGAEAHMWNYVQMENNNWYAVDITWDDQPRIGIQYDYFLCGSKTRASIGFGGTMFNESHVESRDFSNTNLKYFSYPILNENVYAYSDKVTPLVSLKVTNKQGQDISSIKYKEVLNLNAKLENSPNAKGTIQFKDGENNIGNPVDLNNAYISIDGSLIPFISAGLHQFKAVYIPSPDEATYLTSTSNTINIIIDNSLTGTVNVTGEEMFGKKLTANTNIDGDIKIKYTWKREKDDISTIIQYGDKNTYEINSTHDIGSKIIVEVSSHEFTGVLTSSTKDIIKKMKGTNIDFVSNEKIENDGTVYVVSFEAINGAEWSIDKINWQNSSVFQSITPNTTQNFYVRRKENETQYAGTIFEIKSIYFDKIQNEIKKIDYNIINSGGNKILEISVTPALEGMFYKFNDELWSTSNTKVFNEDSIVTIKVMSPETQTHLKSKTITFTVDLANLKQEPPKDFTILTQQNDDWQTFTATIPEIKGAEYSFDGMNFSSQNTKSDCSASSEVRGYIRIAGKNGYNPSPIICSKIDIPKINENVNVEIENYNNGNLTLNVVNKEKRDKTAIFIIAVYDDKNSILNVVKEQKTFVYGENKEEISIDTENGKVIKVLVWNNLKNMTPIVDLMKKDI